MTCWKCMNWSYQTFTNQSQQKCLNWHEVHVLGLHLYPSGNEWPFANLIFGKWMRSYFFSIVIICNFCEIITNIFIKMNINLAKMSQNQMTFLVGGIHYFILVNGWFNFNFPRGTLYIPLKKPLKNLVYTSHFDDLILVMWWSDLRVMWCETQSNNYPVTGCYLWILICSAVICIAIEQYSVTRIVLSKFWWFFM